MSCFRSGFLFGLGLGFVLVCSAGALQPRRPSGLLITSERQEALQGPSSFFLVSPVQTKATGAFTVH